MNDLQSLAKKVWLIFVGLIVILLAWDWYCLSVSEGGNQARPAPLAEFMQLDAQQALTAMLSHNLWEPSRKAVQDDALSDISTDVTNSAVEEKPWQLVAVAQIDNRLIAYIRDKNDVASLKKYTIGESLPDGKKIVKILHDRVFYAPEQETNTNKDEESKLLLLFGRTVEIGEDASD